jgi:hypothetical protein
LRGGCSSDEAISFHIKEIASGKEQEHPRNDGINIMPTFPGFTSSETFTQIPDSFIYLLKEIDDAAELKVTLYAIWRIEHIEGHFRAMCETDFES